MKNPAVGQDVIATGLGLYQSRAGKVTSFVIETLGHPTKEFDVVITGPQGSAVPVRCYQQKDGNLLAEFTAHGAGIVLHYVSGICNKLMFWVGTWKNITCKLVVIEKC